MHLVYILRGEYAGETRHKDRIQTLFTSFSAVAMPLTFHKKKKKTFIYNLPRHKNRGTDSMISAQHAFRYLPVSRTAPLCYLFICASIRGLGFIPATLSSFPKVRRIRVPAGVQEVSPCRKCSYFRNSAQISSGYKLVFPEVSFTVSTDAPWVNPTLFALEVRSPFLCSRNSGTETGSRQYKERYKRNGNS